MTHYLTTQGIHVLRERVSNQPMQQIAAGSHAKFRIWSMKQFHIDDGGDTSGGIVVVVGGGGGGGKFWGGYNKFWCANLYSLADRKIMHHCSIDLAELLATSKYLSHSDKASYITISLPLLS